MVNFSDWSMTNLSDLSVLDFSDQSVINFIDQWLILSASCSGDEKEKERLVRAIQETKADTRA